MTTIAEFTAETPVFRTAIEAVAGVRITLEQATEVASAGPTWMFWAGGCDLDRFEDGLDADPTVAEFGVRSDLDGRRLYQVHLSERGAEASGYYCWADRGVFLSGEYADGWTVRYRFPSRTEVSAFVECYRAIDGTAITITRLYRDEMSEAAPYGLTGPQRDALVTAAEMGYFAVPRGADLGELADRLGVSKAAASQRVRRGVAALVGTTLLEDSPEAVARPED